MFFGIIYDKILVFIDIMYCKVYRIYIRFGKRIEIFYLVFLLLKSNGDKVNFCLYCMFCDVCKNIRIVKLFIVY